MAKHTGRFQLVQRLTDQVGSEELARKLLIKRGHMYANGTLTPEGNARNNMNAEERALDRAGGQGAYNPRTNRVTKGKK
jgi:hypothetical protein